MIAVLIYITEVVRRAWRKFGNGVSIVIESYQEARELSRNAPRHCMEE
jgi:hypothetical protein